MASNARSAENYTAHPQNDPVTSCDADIKVNIVEEMACRLFDAMPLPTPTVTYYHLDPA